MRCNASPFPDRSESARFDGDSPLKNLFAYKEALNFLKPSHLVKFRHIDRQAQDTKILGIGGREASGRASDRPVSHDRNGAGE